MVDLSQNLSLLQKGRYDNRCAEQYLFLFHFLQYVSIFNPYFIELVVVLFGLYLQSIVTCKEMPQGQNKLRVWHKAG